MMGWSRKKIYEMQSRPDGQADPNDGGVIMAKYIVQSIAGDVAIYNESVCGICRSSKESSVSSFEGPLTGSQP